MKKTTTAKAAKPAAKSTLPGETPSTAIIDDEQQQEGTAERILAMLKTCERPVTRQEAIAHLEREIGVILSSCTAPKYPDELDLPSALDVRRLAAAIEFIKEAA